MCGILGIVTRDSRDNLGEINISALKNRGPDGSGSYVDGGVGLYHARLAVVDKNIMAKQPIISPSGSLVLICNGEVYNYREIKKVYNYDYQTTSDCEVILACYKADGLRGFSKLKGMFSFAIYDKGEKKVIIYRDAVGKKPLFYYEQKERFIFSSSVSAIKDNISAALRIDKDALLYYLKEGYVRPDISFYEGIIPVLPGELIEINISSITKTVQRVVPESTAYDSFNYTHEDIMDESRRLLTKSLEARLYNVSMPVLLFSGGIDSTLLAKKISAITKKKIACVSLRPFLPYTYDEPYGRFAVKKLGLNFIPVKLEKRGLIENIEQAIYLLDQPLSLYAYYLLTYLTRKAREFGNILFLGDGGDEVFYGYSNIRDWFADNEQDIPASPYEVGPSPKPKLSAWGQRQMTVDMLGHSFVKVDKAASEQQMEARCPYLDWDLMHFIRSIPSDYFIKSNTTKIILKEMLEEFPGWFINRKKIGFEFNFRYLMFPSYRYIFNEIDFNMTGSLEAETRKRRFSYKMMFDNFDYFWKRYILTKFLKH
ncbi:MAG: asparagine synthase-related protein [Candidatus Omnitrophota bacterium]